MILQMKFIRSEQNYEAESITLKSMSLKHRGKFISSKVESFSLPSKPKNDWIEKFRSLQSKKFIMLMVDKFKRSKTY